MKTDDVILKVENVNFEFFSLWRDGLDKKLRNELSNLMLCPYSSHSHTKRKKIANFWVVGEMSSDYLWASPDQIQSSRPAVSAWPAPNSWASKECRPPKLEPRARTLSHPALVSPPLFRDKTCQHFVGDWFAFLRFLMSLIGLARVHLALKHLWPTFQKLSGIL